jgi:TolB-like protein/Tfp pilus assembly protein PilF
MLSEFLEELRRRKVVRVALLYYAAMFALLEFADIAFPRLGFSDSAIDMVLVIGLIGFPVALVVAWFFDIAPQISGDNASVPWATWKTWVAAVALMALGVIAGALWGLDATTEKTTVTQPKIIVLPFANLGEDPARQFFSDGLSEDISSKLSRFPGLTIVPASVTHEVAGSDHMALGRELNANYIISGSVRQSGDQVRITAQLIDLHGGNQVWADSYDRELTAANLFSLQADVAQRVVAAIGDPTGVLNRVAVAALRNRPTDSLEAYECVLRGYAYLRIHDDESHALARDCLEQAVELDPGYVEAWAQLAYLYREEYHHNRNARPDPLGRAEQAVQRALALDTTNAMLSFAMSMIAFSREDVTAGLAHGEQAAELNPNNATILAAVAIYYAQCGNVDGALELGRKVQSIHPTLPRWVHMIFATAYYLRGEYDQSLEAVALWNQPNDVQWHYQRTANLAQLGRLPEARAALDEMLDTYPKFAADPVTELRKYMLVEETVEPFLDGLAKAGLEIPNTP